MIACSYNPLSTPWERGTGQGSSHTLDVDTLKAFACCSRPASPSLSACLRHLHPLPRHSPLLADYYRTNSY